VAGFLNSADGDYDFIGCGNNNHAAGGVSCIAGGAENTTTGMFSVIGGGKGNETVSLYGAVVGGNDNQAGASETDSAAFVGGGRDNQASSPYSCIVGGRSNITEASYSFIGGGFEHINQGTWSAIPGGEGDTIGFFGHHSMAFGKGVFVSDPFQVMLFDGNNHGSLGINRDERDGGLDHPLHVGTNTSNGNGAHLTAGGVWTNGSSAAFKDRFEKLDSREILAKVATLSIDAWRFKATDERHIGPISEEFVETFDVGVFDASDGRREDDYLSTVDVAGVALLAIQELNRKTEELERRAAEIDDLRTEIAELKKTLSMIMSEQ
jgi:hypothetical protein